MWIEWVLVTEGVGEGKEEGRISRGWIAHEDVSKGRNYDAVSFGK
jgi:hypothetical protein